jgi:translation initiation factor IF-2
MGPIYTGKIESLHIEKDAVREAVKGQQVGLKIKNFNKAKLGDLVETFQSTSDHYAKPWQPQGKIFYP